jgi:hypothetical protein
MRFPAKLVIVTSTIALTAAPALALGAPTGAPGSHGKSSLHKSSTPGPNASMPAKAKAYGKRCQGESKQHVAGQPGTPFSKCVTDMAKVANGSVKNPTTACKNESKKHVAGQHGTPFSQCVSGAAKLLKQSRSSSTPSS